MPAILYERLPGVCPSLLLMDVPGAERACCIRLCSPFSMLRNRTAAVFPASSALAMWESQAGKESLVASSIVGGMVTGSWPTPPIRSTFWRMLEKKGLTGFDEGVGMTQPPAIDGAVGRVRLIDRLFFARPAAVEEDELGEVHAATAADDEEEEEEAEGAGRELSIQSGNWVEKRLKPPARTRDSPFQPSLENFWSKLTSKAASFGRLVEES